jgi:HSP20 family protein
VLTAELPGVAREDIDIQLREDRLTLSGVRRDRGVPCEQYHRLERGHGAFSRTFQLPVPVDADQVVADLRDGILTVTCPKARDGSTRRIDVL